MSGSVILVGAGPGDAGLLTLRGKQAIEAAEVVLYDRLVSDGVLALIPPDVQLVDVGKSTGRHPIPQDEINALILQYAQEGKRVVRLKGGDPYLFGRGAEELEAVIGAGIPFEVVPGITSAMAVPAYAGIPVSHRELASSVHIITGHLRHGALPAIDFDSLVRLGGTLIFLMSVGALKGLTSGLLEAGMATDTPAALIENGTRPDQRRLLATVATIAEQAVAESFTPPSVLIVGEVCSLADTLDWATRRPLSGVRVLVTRARDAAGTLTDALREQGCDAIPYPCIRTEPLPPDPALFAHLDRYSWIVFTSPVGAGLFFRRLAEQSIDVRSLAGVKFAAVGAKTAGEITARGILPSLVPDSYDAASLGSALLQQAAHNDRVLLYRAEICTPGLVETLRKDGLAVDDVAAYRTCFDSPAAPRVRELLEQGDIDFVTFTSASTVEGFARSLPGLDLSAVTGVCIGASTAAAARSQGMRVLISEAATVDSMVQCILQERLGESS